MMVWEMKKMETIACHVTLVIDGYAWGPSISRIILRHEDFSRLKKPEKNQLAIKIAKQHVWADILIDDIYCHANEIHVIPVQHPDFHQLSPMVYDHRTNRNTFIDRLDIRIVLKYPLVIDSREFETIDTIGKANYLIPQMALFRHTEFCFNTHVVLQHLFFKPHKATKVPLLVWLHGAGEGGTDERTCLMGNPVTRFVEPVFQGVFGDCAVLFPQALTFWMDDGSGLYTKTGNSMYTKALHGLIRTLVRDNPEIDPYRIYLGGCSNGGYMVMELLKRYPDMFAAAFPVCEAFSDKWLSDEDIDILATKPIWFVQALNDQVVKPQAFVLPTYARLKQAKASNVHLTLIDSVTDLSGKYTTDEEKPYEYPGHASWIPVLNNWIGNADEGSLFEWIARQRLEKWATRLP